MTKNFTRRIAGFIAVIMLMGLFEPFTLAADSVETESTIITEEEGIDDNDTLIDNSEETEYEDSEDEELPEESRDGEETEGSEDIKDDELTAEENKDEELDAEEDENIMADEDILVSAIEAPVVFVSEMIVIDNENFARDRDNNVYTLIEGTNIVSEGNLEIVLEDSNATINSLYIEGNLTISGEGQLNIISDNNEEAAVEVYGKLKVESGTLNIINDEGKGIYVEKDLIVEGSQSNVNVESFNSGIYAEGNITADSGHIYSKILESDAETGAVYAEGEIKVVNEGQLWEGYAAVIEINEEFQVEVPFYEANINKLSNYSWNSGLIVDEEEECLEWTEAAEAVITELSAVRNEYVSGEQVYLEDAAVHKITFYNSADSSLIMPLSISTVTVNNNSDLKDALEATGLAAAGGMLEITLTNDFVTNFTDKVTATLNTALGYDIVINGGNQTLGVAAKKTFEITNNSASILTIKDLDINAGTGMNLTGSGSYVLENVSATGLTGYVVTFASTAKGDLIGCTFENGAGSVISGAEVRIIDSKFLYMTAQAVKNVKNLYIENSLFKGNSAWYGAAIEIPAQSKTEIVSSSFIDNTGFWSGYHGGAISAEQVSNVTLIVSKSYFKGNVAANTGASAGGLGGGISLYLSYNSYLEVDQCVFNENKSTVRATTSDGGAISIKNNKAGDETTYSITNSTFFQNTTKDDAGAILLEGYSSAKVTGTIANCTFMGNVGEGNEADSNGGAVQLFTSGAKADFLFNTFYGNKIGGSGVTPTQGGAVGLSGFTLLYGIPITSPSEGNFTSNLFIENENVGSNSSKNVYSVSASKAKDIGGNVGYDQGKNLPQITAFQAFGTDTPILKENGEVINVGCDIDGGSALTTLKTLLIAPEFAANRKGIGAAGYSLDERGRVRNVPDAGALDINWVKFNANGGEWPGITATAYNTAGDEFSLYNDTDSICDIKYAVDTTDINNVTAPSNPEYDSYVFIGWSLTQFDINEGTLTDCVDPADLDYEDQTLYAVWRDTVVPVEQYTVTYDANGGTGTVVDANNPYDENDTVTVLDKGNMARDGYDFIGWNTEANGSGTSYNPNNTFVITEDTVLYAQWKKIVTPGPDPGPGPTPEPTPRPDREDKDDKEDKITDNAVVEAFNPMPEVLDKENHFAYIVGYPDKTVKPENNITRAEAASIFFRLLTQQYREEIWSKSNNFSDVQTGDWYMNAVSTLSRGGILSGYLDGTFRPAASITRGEFASIAVRFSQEEIVVNSKPFTDIEGHWAEEDIIKAYTLGYVSGMGNGEFRPDTPITRAEVASLLNNVLNRHVNSEEDMLSDMVKWPDNTSDKWYYYDMQEATNSHDYIRKSDNINETWTDMRKAPNWGILNDPDAQPRDLVIN